MIANPPEFSISDGCCKGAKKDVAHDYMKEIKLTINVVGIRRAEGGARATAYKSFFQSRQANRNDRVIQESTSFRI